VEVSLSIRREATVKYRGLDFKNRTRILPLTLVPKNGTSVLDWRPFPGGDTLDKIIGNVNDRCIKAYEDLRWLPAQIEAFVEIFDVVPYGVTSLSQLRSPDFKDIRILLVNLDVVSNRQGELGQVKVYVSEYHQQHWFYLTQVRKESDTHSLVEFFAQLPVFSVPQDPPQILEDQAEFETFLSNLCRRYFGVISALPPPPAPPPGTSGTPEIQRVTETYLDSLPRIAADARDIGITRDLSTEDTAQLAAGAAMQELALAQIAERARPQSNYQVTVDAIRQPILGVAAEPRLENPSLDTVDLLEVNAARPLSALSDEQQSIMADLGITGETSAAVHLDHPGVQDLIADLGGAVETTKFSSELPRW
jgi:hypothetical protein